jgi:S-adenosylmethionine hydrolase
LQAAYICSNAFRHFPAEAFHLVIVNLFEGEPKELLLAKHNDQFIACPNNGILTLITASRPKELIALPVTSSSKGLLDFTRVAAEAFAKINKGEQFNNLGNDVNDMVEKYPLRSTIGADWIEGQIIFIDNFENVVVNITKAEFEEQRKGRSFKIVFTREVIETLSDNYSSVNEGELLAWFNSAGYLEIAMSGGKMAGLFGLQGFSEKLHTASQNKWFYQTVRIFFE